MMLSSFDWLRPALGHDGGLASVVKAGDLVQHRNGGQWGRVLRVVPQRDGTAELQIEGICRPECRWDDPSVRWWATYHIRDWAPSYGPVQEAAHGTV
ncbi:MAG TPA: hypothetical protein VLE97_11255 [Gaiellaceae bacterium]|nr:hypothetical protein [Gaiellaceae bacterium]